MPKEDNNHKGQWLGLLPLITALSVLTADQLSKLGIRINLAVGESIPENGFIGFHHVQNSGAAFGLFQGYTLPLIVIALIGIALITYALFFGRFSFLESTESRLAFSLVMGGTAGNLVDRIAHGVVTDFIEVGPWPEFNIADSAVVIGTTLFAYTVLRQAFKGQDRDGQEI
jgi:signal peptidase II